eukprot:Skav216753  [mRNA]  locus=scaffold2717:59862:61733:- [translate_table: standard]
MKLGTPVDALHLPPRPTNHLSAEGCGFLEETLRSARDVSLVLVSHDRYEVRAGEVQDAKVQLRRAEEWAKRGPRGRGTKNQAPWHVVATPRWWHQRQDTVGRSMVKRWWLRVDDFYLVDQ